MRCQRCNYSIADVPGNQCPECGRGFDADDMRTFLVEGEKPIRRSWTARIQLVLALAPLAWLVFPYSAAIVGYQTLGRFPRWPGDYQSWRASADRLFGLGMTVFVLLHFVVVAGLIATACLIDPVRRQGNWRWFVGRVAMVFASPVILWAVFQLDPGRILYAFTNELFD